MCNRQTEVMGVECQGVEKEKRSGDQAASEVIQSLNCPRAQRQENRLRPRPAETGRGSGF
jgi:hypothetical protein